MPDNRPQINTTQKFNRKQARIIDAATAVFNEKGLKGSRISDIAASVGLATTSVTYYFKRKEDLAAACYLQTISEFHQLASNAQSESTARRKLKSFLSEYFELRARILREEHPPLMLFNEIRALEADSTDWLFEAYVAMFRDIRALLVHDQTPSKKLEASQLRRAELNSNAHLLLSHILWIPVWLHRYSVDDYPRVTSHLAGLLSDGIATNREWKAPEFLPHDAPTDPRSTFLRAATAMINDRGFRGASVDMIADSLDLTKGSFYHHYDSKEELAYACFDYTFEIIERVLAQVPTGLNQAERLNYTLSNLVHCQLAPAGPLLTMGTISTLDPKVRPQIVRRYQALTQRFADIIIDGMIEGSLQRVEPLLAAELVIQTVNAAPELPRWAPGLSVAESVQLLVAPLFEGMLPQET